MEAAERPRWAGRASKFVNDANDLADARIKATGRSASNLYGRRAKWRPRTV